MTWDEIKEASKYGEIELHSYSHKQLVKLTNEEIIKDTNLALEIFEKNLGFKPKAYSYPYGEYDEKVKNDYGKNNYKYFKDHLSMRYRYYVKRQVLIKDKSKLYKAQPWETGSEEIPL